ELWPADRRMSYQEVVDASIREDLCLGKRGAGQTDGAVDHLTLGHVGALVRLGVWPQLDVVVGGESGHSYQVALDDFFVNDSNRCDDVLSCGEHALDVHTSAPGHVS